MRKICSDNRDHLMWENWKQPGGEWIRTFAVITTDANELVADIHDRMPVSLSQTQAS